jgi:hypothetical protein
MPIRPRNGSSASSSVATSGRAVTGRLGWAVGYAAGSGWGSGSTPTPTPTPNPTATPTPTRNRPAQTPGAGRAAGRVAVGGARPVTVGGGQARTWMERAWAGTRTPCEASNGTRDPTRDSPAGTTLVSPGDDAGKGSQGTPAVPAHPVRHEQPETRDATRRGRGCAPGRCWVGHRGSPHRRRVPEAIRSTQPEPPDASWRLIPQVREPACSLKAA